MTLRRFLSVLAVFLSPVLMSGASASAAAPGTSSASQLQLTDKTEVPGQTLKPGSYTIRVVDRLRDRVIVRVTGGNTTVTFLGLPNTDMPKPSGAGPVNWSTDEHGKSALRGFSFPDGTTVEFVYPKSDAVALAKANNAQVVAIDPKSEGRVDMPNLSQADMQMVTLWMLTPTPVGPGDPGPGITAARYQVASEQTPPSPAPPVRTVHKVAALPHTAGSTALLLLCALFCLGGAAVLSVRRLAW